MINEVQKATLIKLEKKYKINVSQFIRTAIKEKIDRDWLKLQENLIKNDCPF